MYSLHRSPQHWYEKIKVVLHKLGLCQNAYDPCLFTGSISDHNDPTDSPSSSPLTLGIYVDDFTYFSADPDVKCKFQLLLKKYVTVNFMGPIEWFLGQHFQWKITSNEVHVHLSQTGFASHLVEDNNIHLCSITSDATPYRSGLAVHAITDSDEDKESPTFIKHKHKYQSIVGLIGWLAQTTCLNLAPSHFLLSSYSNKPSRSHLNSALYILHYIHSAINYGFTLLFQSVGTPAHLHILSSLVRHRSMCGRCSSFS